MLCAMTKLVNLSKLDISKAYHDVRECDVLFDSGANCCVTNRRSDFVGPFHKTDGSQIVDGIGKGLKVEGKGYVAWTFRADNGMYRTIKVPCFYVPSGNSQIASVQEVVLKAYPKEQVTMNGDSLTLSGHGKVPSLTVPCCLTSNLPSTHQQL